MAPQFARALYDFPGAQDGDMAFAENDVLIVLERDESGWWSGEHSITGKRGEFPFNYVELISEDEARRAERGRGESRPGGSAGGGAGGGGAGLDAVKTVKVSGSEFSGRKTLWFKIEARTAGGKEKKCKKALAQVRELDRLLRKGASSASALPPAWCDSAKLGVKDTEKRQKAVEAFLAKVASGGQWDAVLLSFLVPKEEVKASGEVAELCKKARAIGEEKEQSGSGGERVPQLANVEFTWMPQDSVELYMQEGQIIEVVTQETGSPGWWKGRTVDGMVGLFPYNHVELLDERVAQAVCNGTSLGKAQEGSYSEPQAGGGGASRKSASRNSMARISLGLFGGGGSSKDKDKARAEAAEKERKAAAKAAIKPRQKKVVYPFTMSTCDAFDRLIDTGFTIEENAHLLSMTPPRDAPKDGDFVQLSYCAYVWDCQKQTLIEFAASDNPGRLAEAGPMEFFVGKGEVIKGIEYAVTRMTRGQTVRIVVTPQLAYGAVGLPPEVPPNSHVVYDLTLDAFGHDGDGGAAAAAAPPQAPAHALDAGVVMANPPSAARKNSTTAAPSKAKATTPKGAESKPSGGARAERAETGGGGGYQQSTFASAQSGSSAQARAAQASPPGPGGFKPPQGKDVSLSDAIAMRRAKVDGGGGAANIMRPVQERTTRRQVQGPNAYAGRERIEIDNDGGEAQQAQPQARGPTKAPAPRQAPQQQQQQNQQQGGAKQAAYTLKQLQEFVRDKRLDQLGIDGEQIEDWMAEDEFNKAFQMSRDQFLLKPRWRQQALKRGLRLF